MISCKNVDIKIRTNRIIQNLNLEIKSGEPIGIIGNNGTGKTILAKAIAGLIPLSGEINASFYSLNKVFVSFQSSFKIRNGFSPFRQQRWNNLDPDAVPKVYEELEYSKHKHLDTILDKFDFKRFLNHNVISLSNGEQKKLELIRALAQQPELLILDNVYNGLDAESRLLVSQVLDKMTDENQTFIMTGLKKDDFPSSVNQFILLRKNSTPILISKEQIPNANEPNPFIIHDLPHWHDSSIHEIISIKNLTMNFGEKTILNGINWNVLSGEKWVLSGNNGSGKTSLLNLIFADNPKAYGFDLKLFGQQRGSRESIWDIKNKIGFISPELQQYLPKNQNALQVICSGFFVSEGLYNKPTSYQFSLAKEWLRLLGNTSWEKTPYGELSASEQRIILIIRSIIKNPPLLLLDEPFQGLDSVNTGKITILLNQIASKTNCTMILTTHYQNEIPQFFTHELKLMNGEIAYSGKFNQSIANR